MDHLKDDIKSLRKKFPGFDDFPHEAKKALLDMEYNVGRGEFREKGSKIPWTQLFPAVQTEDWEKAASESGRKGLGNPDTPGTRNYYTKQQFIKAKKKK
ncbi:MAG: hypothetical protein GY793_09995 [Proteobacteria bacterium]|nr:hypothetical protein [Pseudomonadota bacterium]